MASASTRRPSASVFRISMVLPPYCVMTSPGRYALPPGMFSAIGTVAVTGVETPKRAARTTVAITAAAPPISEIMFSMLAPGFSEIPPVSKVMPLPTSPSDFSADSSPFQIRRTRRGPREDPPPTALRPPKPPAHRASSSSTSTSSPASRPSAAAASANVSG